MIKMNGFDRMLHWFAPQRTVRRLRARAAVEIMTRNYEAASTSRRTSGWIRNGADANVAAAKALHALREHARDLVRNNANAEKGLETITGNTVSWGFTPRPVHPDEAVKKEASDLWKKWAESTDCDADGQLTFSGLQELVMRTVVESGECLIRMRPRRISDGHAIPMRLQVLEPDLLDTAKDGVDGPSGPIIQGVEFDLLGERVAYWLFDRHPGSGRSAGVSKRYPASIFLHVYRKRRPGQVRGVTWFASTVTPLKDFDEFEDAQIMRQKIAACFVGAVTDEDGDDTAAGQQDPTNEEIEEFQPGTMTYLKPGRKITFGNPPSVTDDGFSTRIHRKIANGLGNNYEEQSGDYSNVNFSSARMSRLASQKNVHKWRWNMFVPMFLGPVWGWAMESAVLAGLISEVTDVEWAAPPMDMIEPDKEVNANTRAIRSGQKTLSEIIREQGGDPQAHLQAYAEEQKLFDKLGLKLDCDVRAVSQAGLTQQRAGMNSGDTASQNADTNTTG